MTRTLFIPALLMSLPLSPLLSEASPKDSYEKVYKECMQMDHFKADDGALNAAYKKLITALPPEEAAKLKADQKQWIKDCAWQVTNDGRPHKNLSRMTFSRKEELEEMLSKLKK
jgi:uncharacterized protein YecT (DUF1311 family)